MPAYPSFTGPSYKLENVSAAGDRTINLYNEAIEVGPRAGSYRLRQIYGLSQFKTLAPGPIRGIWSSGVTSSPWREQCYVVSGGTLYQIFTDGGADINLGPLANSANPAIITANGFQLAIASNGIGYIVPGGGAGVIPIVDTAGDPINASSICFLDQYFIAAIINTKQVRISNLAPDGGTWPADDVAFKEAYADNIVRAYVDQPGGEYLWLFGDETTEVWGSTPNAGVGQFPFSRIQSYVFSIGCDSTWSVAGQKGFRAWLWRGQIYGCDGFSPERISDYGVEQAIQGYSEYDQHNAEAFSWIERGHVFYAISFPEASRTWVFDLSSKSWHERLRFENGEYSRYAARCHTLFNGRHLVGDYRNGNVYRMSQDVYTDQGDGGSIPLRRQRIAPYVVDSMKNDRYNRLTLDMDTGIGLDVGSEALGYDPNVMMRYSWNRGKNWSNYLQCSAGKEGEDEARVFWTQLGASRIGMAFDVSMTDPVPLSINGALLDIGPGDSPGNRPTS